jgi:hypothetical protein
MLEWIWCCARVPEPCIRQEVRQYVGAWDRDAFLLPEWRKKEESSENAIRKGGMYNWVLTTLELRTQERTLIKGLINGSIFWNVNNVRTSDDEIGGDGDEEGDAQNYGTRKGI